MPTYVWRNGDLVNKDTGEPMVIYDPLWEPESPYIVFDTPGYVSPVSGKWVDGRSARREDLKKNDCVELPPPTKERRQFNEERLAMRREKKAKPRG